MTTLSDTPGEGLANCPFCGTAEPIINEIEPHKHHFVNMPDYPGSFTVECAGCDIGVIRPTKSEVIAAWNRRSPSVASDTAALALIEELEQALEPLVDDLACGGRPDKYHERGRIALASAKRFKGE